VWIASSLALVAMTSFLRSRGDFMVRDSKRFPNTGSWGYAQSTTTADSETFKPLGTGSACGHASRG
jgi:hypothetical protein